MRRLRFWLRHRDVSIEPSTPTDDLYDEKKYPGGLFATYECRLRSAFKDERVRNIAVVGNYGVGKSSIIRSYNVLHEGRKKSYLYISLIDFNFTRDFFGSASEKQKLEGEELDAEIERFEKYLLSQVLTRANDITLPESGFKLIPKKRFRSCLPWASFGLFAVSVLLLVFRSQFAEALNLILNLFKTGIDDPDVLQPYLYIAIGGFFITPAIATLKHLRRNIVFGGLKLKFGRSDSECETDFKNRLSNEKSYLDRHLFEMIYALESISDDIGHTVVFEDFDRLDENVCIDIFSKLSRLCRMINDRGKRIRFVYAFNNSIFSLTKNNKLFDYVLHVQPIVNRASAGMQLKRMLKEMLNGGAEKGVPERKLSRIVTDHGVKKDEELTSHDMINPVSFSSRTALIGLIDDVKDEEWDLIGRCAYDMRSMKHIVEDFRLFAASMLWMNRIPDRSWLPFVIYRNIMHRDFHRAHGGDSVFDTEDKNERREMIYDGIDGSDIYKEDVCELFEMFIRNGYIDRKAINRLTTVSDYDTSIDELINIASSINAKTVSGKQELANIFDRVAEFFERSLKHDPALEYYKRAADLRREALGEEHPDTAASYNNIAGVYYVKGEYDLALEYSEKALAIREKVLGREHPSTAGSYYNIGLVYYDKGEYDRALEYSKKVLAINEKVYGKEHPHTATSYNNIVKMYRSKGEYDRALEYHEKALAIFENELGIRKIFNAELYCSMAQLYNNMDSFDRALEYHEKALAEMEKVLGREHPYTKETYELLKLTYDKTEFKGGNKPSFEEWLESERKKRSADSGKASEEQ
ncbi:MAG: tetratricopeptide repeat protein [Clostridia bacterium]|nr:tetratricopeptide repeat protein [Clostridia bacterium]